MITTAFLSEDESPSRARLWFFCDELKTAGRLESLPALLNARSKGVRCALGFQDIEGLVQAYSNIETPKEILSRCATVSWLKITSPDTAQWAAKRVGELERFEYLESKTKGGTSTGEQLVKREGILPSQFQNLRDFTSGSVEGIHMIKGVGGPFVANRTYLFPEKNDVPDFDPRPTAEQILEPWGPADDEWLDGGLQKNPSRPPPDEPDCGAIGRIDF